MRIIFARSVFFIEKINSLENFFEIREKFYKIWGEKQYNGHESFNLVEKMRFYASRGFCQENGLFLVSDCLQHFSDLGWVTFGLWQKFFNRFSKLCFFLSRVTSSGENFYWEKKQFDNFSVIERSFYQKFIEKLSFGWKISAQFSKLDSTLPVGHFEENYNLRKKISWKIFCTSSRFLSSFVEFVRHVYQKCVPVSRWTFWEKNSFQTKSYSRVIFRS